MGISYLCNMIFYLSGTGNTRWAAQQIAAATGEELIFIPNAMRGDCTFSLQEKERIGFCFPVHGWRPPKIVQDFISRLHFDNAGDSHYAYAVCTAGDDIGETMRIFERDLAPLNIHLSAEWSLIMPESYVGLPLMDVDTPDRELAKKRQAAIELSEICRYVTDREEGITHLITGRWPRIKSRLLGGAFLRWLVSDKKFHVDNRRCVKCGICAEVCPVGDIKGGLGHEPEWIHNDSCLTCFSCYHHCPHHAIEFGRQTKHKGQYFFEKRNI